MGKDLNKVMVIGRLGTDPEMKFTPSGAAVTNFRVAAGRQWKDNSGEQHEETEWFSIVVWNKLAEICNQYLTKGSRVYIEGRLQTRSWDDAQTGEKKYRTEVVANDMIILESKNGGTGERYGNDDDDGWDDAPAPAPQRQQQAAAPRQQAQAAPQRQAQPQRQPDRGAAQQRPQQGQRRAQPPVTDDDIPF